MKKDDIIERRDPVLMQKAYEEAKRRKPKAKDRELQSMAKVIYTEEKY